MTDEKDKPEGAIDPEDLVQSEMPKPPEKKEEEEPEGTVWHHTFDSDIMTVAQEVREGKWGVGQERRLKLAQSGYDPKEVEKAVVQLLNP